MKHRRYPTPLLYPLILAAALSSCATFRSGGPLPQEIVPVAAARPERIDPVWQPLGPGLDFFAADVAEPALQLRALRVDLNEPKLTVVLGPPGPGDGTTLSLKTSTFVRDYGCAAGINTLPFEPASAAEGEARRIAGISVADGYRIAPPDPRYAALIFRADGSAAVRQQADLAADDPPRQAAGGFFIVLDRGQPQGNDRYRNPRTAAGVAADGRTLYLLVVDGRRRASVGATARETGLILARLGAVDGLILDGGGSSAMALRGDDGTVRLVNVPVHSRFFGGERAVAGCLGLRY